MRSLLNLSLAVVALTALPCPAPASPRTLREELAEAPIVLVGRLTNATPPNPADTGPGTTDFVVRQALKLPPGFPPQKTLTLHHYLPAATQGKSGLLLFVDVFKGKLDPYKGITFKANSDLPKYLAGILKIKDEKPGKRLRFYFDYLQNADTEIANDAQKEFDKAGYKELARMAGRLPGDKVAAWLKDPKTPAYRIGLYASMLGHCSKDKEAHARLLRSLIDDPRRHHRASWDGVLAGYILLKPKEGLACARDILGNPKKELLLRYTALRAVRFFIDSRPDVLPRQDVLQAVALLLPQADIADLPIEDFRRWKCWELTPHVLALTSSKKHDIPLMQRAILRFALSCPRPEAKAFVADRRKSDPQAVLEAEEHLKLEREQAAPPK